MFYSVLCEVWAPVPRVPRTECGKSVSHRKAGGSDGGEESVWLEYTHLWILDISFQSASLAPCLIYCVPLDVSVYLLGLSFCIYKMGSLITAL